MKPEYFKEKFENLNTVLADRTMFIPPKEVLRDKLSEIGTFKKIERLTGEELEHLSNGKGAVGVDGSCITFGTSMLNQMFICQALAKCTNAESGDDGLFETDILTPLSNGFTTHSDMETSALFSRQMAVMENTAALKAIAKYNPFTVLFDGGFWRLSEASRKMKSNIWSSFKQQALANNVIPVGVIEDVGTFNLADLIRLENEKGVPLKIMDSELLFNVLEVDEVLILKEPYSPALLFEEEEGEKYMKVFARFSQDPLPIACDFLSEQTEVIEQMLRFLYTITPKNGRGIPYWIDIVDQEVKITRQGAQALVDTFLQADVKEKMFNGKRNKRDS